MKHMSDKSKKHEVVEFSDRKETLVYPGCKSHENKCELYCRGCMVPICIKCVINMHKDHDVIEIEEIVQRQRVIVVTDTERLKKKVSSFQMRKQDTSRGGDAFDKVTVEITRREKEIQEMTRDVAERMRKEVAKKKEENETLNAENKSKLSDAKRKLQGAIENNSRILQSRNIMDLVNYREHYDDLTKNLKLEDNLNPMMMWSELKENRVFDLFGILSFEKDRKVKRIFQLKDKPEVLTTIQSPHKELWRVMCAENGRIWTSGDGLKIVQIDKWGKTLQTVKTSESIRVLSINRDQCLIFSTWTEEKVRIYKDGNVDTYLNIANWRLRGICQTKNGDMLMSVRSVDYTQSKVVRYSGTMEKQTIQYDGQRQPLFSTRQELVLLLTENGNGDICVADCAGKAVVVVNASGVLRFKYRGNSSIFSDFKPSKITTDVYHHILINDNINDIIHIVNSDGDFIRFIEYACTGGLSIDADHNLVIGDKTSGKIRIIKYLS
jgi:hypothetical protein